ncbi:hypothetical protein LTR28_006117 [Elasticomyces elasticus]|nr:hypothetical protein LTR28_006117 [Elasticomyces elasticus]
MQRNKTTISMFTIKARMQRLKEILSNRQRPEDNSATDPASPKHTAKPHQDLYIVQAEQKSRNRPVSTAFPRTSKRSGAPATWNPLAACAPGTKPQYSRVPAAGPLPLTFEVVVRRRSPRTPMCHEDVRIQYVRVALPPRHVAGHESAVFSTGEGTPTERGDKSHAAAPPYSPSGLPTYDSVVSVEAVGSEMAKSAGMSER